LEWIKFVASVTVIIPTKNSGRTLRGCLEFIWNQSNQHFEILVIVNKSRDDTIEIAKSLKVTILTFNKIKIDTVMDLFETFKQIYTIHHDKLYLINNS
jgi:glycosyltransferase involved in cell wall biosynthesis